MPKFFVTADIHGFYDEFIEALMKAGYDKEDESHYLICCGDYTDRGPKPKEVIDFLSKNPRTILIRGNHEVLWREMVRRGYYKTHDIHNGTVDTALVISKMDVNNIKTESDWTKVIKKSDKIMSPFIDKTINFFETEKYIFCHSWIPMKENEYSYDDGDYYWDWRSASNKEWEDAMWGNPFLNATHGKNQTGKTIVFGHFHTSHFHSNYENGNNIDEFSKKADFSPAYSEEYKIIGLDACTAFSGRVNIVVLEDDFLN